MSRPAAIRKSLHQETAFSIGTPWRACPPVCPACGGPLFEIERSSSVRIVTRSAKRAAKGVTRLGDCNRGAFARRTSHLIAVLRPALVSAITRVGK